MAFVLLLFYISVRALWLSPYFFFIYPSELYCALYDYILGFGIFFISSRQSHAMATEAMM